LQRGESSPTVSHKKHADKDMASASFQSSHVELWGQPEITRPEPLRIVKECANTIAGSSASREIPIPRRGSAGQHDTRGSSPEGLNRSLTIYKRRRTRGSILDGSLDWNSYDTPLSLSIEQTAGGQIRFLQMIQTDNNRVS